jgi:hypothetical protein
MQKVENEAVNIARTTELSAAMRAGARGWLGPGLSETWETPVLLLVAGSSTMRSGARRPASAAQDALRLLHCQRALHKNAMTSR